MPYPAIPTVWLEPTDRIAVGLRRYRSTAGDGLTCETGYHSALMFTGEESAAYRETDHGRVLAARPSAPHDDPRWPVTCACGYGFVADDHWQDWQELLYRRTDTGEVVTLRERQSSDEGGPVSAPPGAAWDAWWMPKVWRGPDGIALMVRLPNGHDWHVDGEASNCTRKGDKTHRCWVRHGDPRTEQVHVDKDGDTCAAGAGSIQAGDYHGFLAHGCLTAG
jgi:hypothetical protein